MSSPVSICNQALSWLGEDPIMSLDDESKSAKLCKANYTDIRDTVIEEGRWSFATRRYTLDTKAGTDPNWGFDNRFLLDTKIMLVIQARDDIRDDDGRSNIKWSVEENYLFANIDVVYIKTIVQITDENKYTNTARQAISARMASVLAMPLTESAKKEADMDRKYEAYMAKALALDGSQGSPQRIRGSSLKRVR